MSGYLCLPRGCELDLVELLNVYKVDFELNNDTSDGRPIDVTFNGELRGEQTAW